MFFFKTVSTTKNVDKAVYMIASSDLILVIILQVSSVCTTVYFKSKKLNGTFAKKKVGNETVTQD